MSGQLLLARSEKVTKGSVKTQRFPRGVTQLRHGALVSDYFVSSQVVIQVM